MVGTHVVLNFKISNKEIEVFVRNINFANKVLLILSIVTQNLSSVLKIYFFSTDRTRTFILRNCYTFCRDLKYLRI